MATSKKAPPKMNMDAYGAPPSVDLNGLEESSYVPTPQTNPLAADQALIDAARQEKIRKMEDAAYNRNVTSPDALNKKKGGAIKKEPKGHDWHGFGHSKPGKNNHGF